MTMLLLPPARGFDVRDYQTGMIDAAFAAWRSGARSVMIQAPTGSGKSVCQAEMIRRVLLQGFQVLVAVHRIELVHQLAATFEHHCGVKAEMVTAGRKVNWSAPLLVGMNQTLIRRLEHIPQTLRLFVQDEAHRSVAETYIELYDALPDACDRSGWTATPVRTKSGEGFRDVYDELVPGPQTRWLIDNGYLSPYRYFADPTPMRTKGVDVVGGDYNLAQLARANESTALSASVLQSYEKHCPGLRAVVFCINVEHSQAIAQAFNDAGIPAAHLDAKSHPKHRRFVIEQFRAGGLQVLTNVGLYGEGLDIPALEACVIARPTRSLALYLQMAGRALRYVEGKVARIVDLAGCWIEHGLPCDERTWTLDAVEREERILELVDDEVREWQPPDTSTGDAELVELDPDAVREWRRSWERLLSQQAERGYKDLWLWHRLREAGDTPLEVWRELAERLGRKPGWGWHQWRCWTLRLDEPDYIEARAKWSAPAPSSGSPHRDTPAKLPRLTVVPTAHQVKPADIPELEMSLFMLPVWNAALQQMGDVRGTQVLLRQKGALMDVQQDRVIIHVVPRWLGTLQLRHESIAEAFQAALGRRVDVVMLPAPSESINVASTQH